MIKILAMLTTSDSAIPIASSLLMITAYGLAILTTHGLVMLASPA
jgi:hypothetical protein